MQLLYGLTVDSSGQVDVTTKFSRRIYAAIPVASNISSYNAVTMNGFSVNRSDPPFVSVFCNCSGDDDSGSGVLPDQESQEFELLVFGEV